MGKILSFASVILFLIALLYRVYPLTIDHPFWVDEFSTAIQAKIYTDTFPDTLTQKHYDIEPNNYFFHSIVGVFFLVFGEAAWVARLPAVLAGAAIPVLLFYYGKNILSLTSGLIAYALLTFSYLHLTWSTQARGYTWQQFFMLVSHLLILRLTAKTSQKEKVLLLAALVVCCLLGVLTHTTFIINIAAIAVYVALVHKKVLFKQRKIMIILAVTFIASLFFWLPQIIKVWQAGFISLNNNLWYYHALLWRQETLISFLAGIGIIKALLERKKEVYLPLIAAVFYFILYTFIFQPYTTRYVMSYYPFLVLFAGYGIYVISAILSKKAVFVSFLLTGFILLNGNTFEIVPKKYYSVNHHMRDIALVDYHAVYQQIVDRIMATNEPVAMIDTWRDRAWWYLGIDYQPLYIFRWEKSTNTINGLLASSDYKIENDIKYMVGSGEPPVKMIIDLRDLQNVMMTYTKGYIWIDDSSLPADVIQYVQTNMKKESYVDHYQYDDNPYSLWPATLYSWGFD